MPLPFGLAQQHFCFAGICCCSLLQDLAPGLSKIAKHKHTLADPPYFLAYPLVEFQQHRFAFLLQVTSFVLAFLLQVTSFVDLMHEYNIPIPDIQAASYATMDSDYTALRDAMWSGG